MAENGINLIYITDAQKAELLEYYVPKLEGLYEQIKRLTSEAGRIHSFINSIGGHTIIELDSPIFFEYPSNGSWNMKIQSVLKKEDRFLSLSEILFQLHKYEASGVLPKSISGVLSSKDSNGTQLFLKQKKGKNVTVYGLLDWANEKGEIKDEYKLK